MDENEPTEEATSEPVAEEAIDTPAPLIPKSQTAAAPFTGAFVPNAEVIVGEWGGMPAYRCSACPFDSLERDKTESHLSIHGMTFTQGARP